MEGCSWWDHAEFLYSGKTPVSNGGDHVPN